MAREWAGPTEDQDGIGWSRAAARGVVLGTGCLQVQRVGSLGEEGDGEGLGVSCPKDSEEWSPRGRSPGPVLRLPEWGRGRRSWVPLSLGWHFAPFVYLVLLKLGREEDRARQLCSFR